MCPFAPIGVWCITSCLISIRYKSLMWLPCTSTTVEINNFVRDLVIYKVWNIPRNAFRWYSLSFCERSPQGWLHRSALHNHLCNQYTSQNFIVGIRYLLQCGDKYFVDGTVIYKTCIIPPNVYRQTRETAWKSRRFFFVVVCAVPLDIKLRRICKLSVGLQRSFMGFVVVIQNSCAI